MNKSWLIAILLWPFTSVIGFAAVPDHMIEVDDPIVKGQKCRVSDRKFSDDYRNNYTSAFDQVFNPYSAEENLWYCEGSGYIAFRWDFNQLSVPERERIASYLKTNKHDLVSLTEKLDALKAIYNIRQTNTAYDVFVLRVSARLHQNAGELKQANQDRLLAYHYIQDLLGQRLPPNITLEYLFLAANYARQFDDPTASDEYLKKLAFFYNKIGFHRRTEFHNQIIDLSQYTRAITKGGVLEPSIPKATDMRDKKKK